LKVVAPDISQYDNFLHTIAVDAKAPQPDDFDDAYWPRRVRMRDDICYDASGLRTASCGMPARQRHSNNISRDDTMRGDGT